MVGERNVSYTPGGNRLSGPSGSAFYESPAIPRYQTELLKNLARLQIVRDLAVITGVWVVGVPGYIAYDIARQSIKSCRDHVSNLVLSLRTTL